MSSSNKSAHFPGLAFDRSGTRRILRQVFANLLATPQTHSVKSPSDVAVGDELLLKLLESVDFVCIGTLTNAKAEYEQRMEAGAPAFDDLKSQGWIEVVREQIVIPVEYLRSFQQAHPSLAGAYEWLQKNQYAIHYSARKPVDSEIARIIESPNNGQLSLDQVRSPRPDWVAARRWEQLCSELPPNAALARWLEEWKLLRWPTFIPRRTWSADAPDQYDFTGRGRAVPRRGIPPLIHDWMSTLTQSPLELLVECWSDVVASCSLLSQFPVFLANQQTSVATSAFLGTANQ